MHLKPGDVVERYTIVGFLGEGGMGEVYRALDARLQRTVALKILRASTQEGSHASSNASDGAARIVREARLVATLDHPNVIAIFDVGVVRHGEPGELSYLAMELIQGKPLRAFVGDASVPMATRIKWMADAARALGAAHKRGLVHRDVKPENVMIREDGVVKVLDFGIAKRDSTPMGVTATSSTEAQLIPTLSTNGVVVGTPYYMAPEQMRAEKLDGRADQFSWGVVAYELLTGKTAWGEVIDAMSLVATVLSRQPTAPHEVDPGVPRAVSDAVMRALAKSPADRFSTMENLIGAIEAPQAAFVATEAFVTPSRAQMEQISGPQSSATHDREALVGRPSRWLTVIGVLAAMACVGALVLVIEARRAAPDRAPSAPPASVAAAAGCTSSAACTREHGGAAHVCRRGACVAVESQDCKVFADARALASDETVWIGAMLTSQYADDISITDQLPAADLARDEIAQMMGGLASQSAAAPARPIALVSCEDATDAARAARHLALDVQVPAVLGFVHGQEVLDLASEVFLPQGILTMATLTSSSLITRIPQRRGQPRLVWRTTYSLDEVATALAALIPERIETSVRKSGSPRELRVALVRTRTPGSLAFSESLFQRLRFNGKSALENAASYKEIALDPEADLATRQQTAAELSTFEPNVVVFIEINEGFVKDVVAPVDAHWRATAGPMPTWIDVFPLDDDVASYVREAADRTPRFLGVQPDDERAPTVRLLMRFNSAQGTKITGADSPGAIYDAFYALAYASYAVGAGPVTGESLSRALAHLRSGRAIEVGPSGIFDAFAALREGGSIDLEGSYSRLALDEATGESPADLAITCVAPKSATLTRRSSESGLVFDAAKQSLVGTIKCP